MSDQRGQSENQNMDRMEQQEQNSIGSQQEVMNDENGSNTRSSNGRSSNRGFAAMSPERQRQIASEGGRAAHRQGVAHEWNSDEARKAGRKGGQIVSQNREHMSEIGRRGGQSSGGRRRNQQQNEAGGNEE